MALTTSSETPTFYDLEKGASPNGAMSDGDIHRAIYNLTMAVLALCDKIDTDAGTTGTDYDTDVGTDLVSAMSKLNAPSKGPVT